MGDDSPSGAARYGLFRTELRDRFGRL